MQDETFRELKKKTQKSEKNYSVFFYSKEMLLNAGKRKSSNKLESSYKLNKTKIKK